MLRGSLFAPKEVTCVLRILSILSIPVGFRVFALSRFRD